MVHGLETMAAMNEAASVQSVADVRFVMTENHCEAVYIDGELFTEEGSTCSIPIGWLAEELAGRLAKITNVTLSDDWGNKGWPSEYADLIPYVETEV